MRSVLLGLVACIATATLTLLACARAWVAGFESAERLARTHSEAVARRASAVRYRYQPETSSGEEVWN